MLLHPPWCILREVTGILTIQLGKRLENLYSSSNTKDNRWEIAVACLNRGTNSALFLRSE
jgi:hypothetical protein